LTLAKRNSVLRVIAVAAVLIGGGGALFAGVKLADALRQLSSISENLEALSARQMPAFALRYPQTVLQHSRWDRSSPPTRFERLEPQPTNDETLRKPREPVTPSVPAMGRLTMDAAEFEYGENRTSLDEAAQAVFSDPDETIRLTAEERLRPLLNR